MRPEGRRTPLVIARCAPTRPQAWWACLPVLASFCTSAQNSDGPSSVGPWPPWNTPFAGRSLRAFGLPRKGWLSGQSLPDASQRKRCHLAGIGNEGKTMKLLKTRRSSNRALPMASKQSKMRENVTFGRLFNRRESLRKNLESALPGWLPSRKGAFSS